MGGRLLIVAGGEVADDEEDADDEDAPVRRWPISGEKALTPTSEIAAAGSNKCKGLFIVLLCTVYGDRKSVV